MRTVIRTSLLLSLMVALFIACAREDSSQTSSTPVNDVSAVGAKFLLADEPAEVMDVIAARGSAEDQEEIAVVGRIGGSVNPWVDGRAAFSIVDPSLQACSDIEGDECTKPWDYCCETEKLPTSTALVKFVDENGGLVKADARELLKLKELQTIVVRGKAERDETGNLTVIANGVYVRK